MKKPDKLHVTLLFLLRDEEILLAMKKRGFGANLLNGVGGKLDPGETVEQAAIRECEEEIGVTPQDIKKVAELNFEFADSNPPQPDMYVTTFVTRSWRGEPTETEEMAPVWYPRNAIPYDKMWEDDQYWLPEVLKGNSVNGNFVFDANNKLKQHEVRVVDSL